MVKSAVQEPRAPSITGTDLGSTDGEAVWADDAVARVIIRKATAGTRRRLKQALLMVHKITLIGAGMRKAGNRLIPLALAIPITNVHCPVTKVTNIIFSRHPND